LGADIFERFTHAGTEYPVYQYIRPNSNYNSPVTDLTSNDLRYVLALYMIEVLLISGIRCNVGANGTNTQTITVAAGDAFSFTADVAVYHDGPLSM